MNTRSLVIVIALALCAACSGSATPDPDATSSGGEVSDTSTTDTGDDTTDTGTTTGEDSGTSEEEICSDPADCDDGLFCNGEETCAPESLESGDDGCVPGLAPKGSDPNPVDCMVQVECSEEEPHFPFVDLAAGEPCDDGIACTESDVCGPDGACAGAPENARCDDGLFCTGVETCNTAIGCLAGTPPVGADEDPNDCLVPGPCEEATDSFALIPAETGKLCDDSVDCTFDDACTGAGTCEGLPSDEFCSDGEFCNGVETCDDASGCVAGDPAEPDVDPDPDDCMVWGPCDEGSDDFPMVAADAGLGCDDGVACTLGDACDDNATCAATPTDAECDDADACNGSETCDPALGCLPGTPIPAPEDPDPDDCSVVDVACDPAQGLWPFVLAGAGDACDDGVDCTTVDHCDDAGDCDGIPDDALCVDGDFCNGAEACDPALGCQEGTALECDDGDFCNGAETCDPALGCQDGDDPTPPIDNDTTDCFAPTLCDEDNDTFVDEPVAETTECEDGDACTTADTCDNAGACLSGGDTDCADTDACTVDACDPETGCSHTPVVCDDPPDALCTGDTHTEYSATGTCDGGTCEYTPTETECTGGTTCDPTLGCTS